MAQTPNVPPVTPPPVVAINTSAPPQRPARRRSNPWGWILGLCAAFAAGLLIGSMIDRGSSLPWTASETHDPATGPPPATITETPEQQQIRAWLDEHMIQRDYEIVGYSEPFDDPSISVHGKELDAIRVTVNVTTPAEGTQRFTVPFGIGEFKGKLTVFPVMGTIREQEMFEELFQSGPAGWPWERVDAHDR